MREIFLRHTDLDKAMKPYTPDTVLRKLLEPDIGKGRPLPLRLKTVMYSLVGSVYFSNLERVLLGSRRWGLGARENFEEQVKFNHC